MRLFFDTSVLVDAERKQTEAIALLEKAADARHRAAISIVTVIEVLMGAQLRKNADDALLVAKEALGQFEWVDLDGRVAEKAAELLAYLRVAGKPVGFQDAAIAACALEFGAEILVTENKEHFARFPPLAGKIFTAKEAARRLAKA